MEYLIIGTGGMGGIIGGYLAEAGKKTAFFARGAHLAAMREKGLVIHTPQRGDVVIPQVEAFGLGDDIPKADVIFVCVKNYSLDDIVPVVEGASREGTVIIPILNGLNAGRFLRGAATSAKVAEGCIYASAYVSAPGEITQSLPNVAVVFGEIAESPVGAEKLEAIRAELAESNINATIADDASAAVYQKFICISAFAAADSIFDTNAGGVQTNADARGMFRSMVDELTSVAEAQKIAIRGDMREHAERWLDAMGPGVTSSLHKDIAAGKPAEVHAFISDVIELADGLGIPVPTYRKAAVHFNLD